MNFFSSREKKCMRSCEQSLMNYCLSRFCMTPYTHAHIHVLIICFNLFVDLRFLHTPVLTIARSLSRVCRSLFYFLNSSPSSNNLTTCFIIITENCANKETTMKNIKGKNRELKLVQRKNEQTDTQVVTIQKQI